jgi:hypothetical protein
MEARKDVLDLFWFLVKLSNFNSYDILELFSNQNTLIIEFGGKKTCY